MQRMELTMYANEIKLYNKEYDKDGIQIIRKKACDINELISNIKAWHDELVRIILFPNNLYYYATNNNDSDFFLKELTEEHLEDIKLVLEVLIKEPDTLYDFYEKRSFFSKKVREATTIEELKEIIIESGIKKVKTTGLKIEQIKASIQRKLCTDFCFGVFGEMLFYNVVENLLYNNLLISKVQLITAPWTNAHGSDGVFCDEDKKILYFGESKFTYNLQQGINQALASMEECLNRINIDKNFMLTHNKDLKNGYGTIINRSNINEYTCKIIIFLLHGTEIYNSDIVQQIEKSRDNLNKRINGLEFLVISFPIYDKENLKKTIVKGVVDYGK